MKEPYAVHYFSSALLESHLEHNFLPLIYAHYLGCDISAFTPRAGSHFELSSLLHIYLTYIG